MKKVGFYSLLVSLVLIGGFESSFAEVVIDESVEVTLAKHSYNNAGVMNSEDVNVLIPTRVCNNSFCLEYDDLEIVKFKNNSKLAWGIDYVLFVNPRYVDKSAWFGNGLKFDGHGETHSGFCNAFGMRSQNLSHSLSKFGLEEAGLFIHSRKVVKLKEGHTKKIYTYDVDGISSFNHDIKVFDTIACQYGPDFFGE